MLQAGCAPYRRAKQRTSGATRRARYKVFCYGEIWPRSLQHSGCCKSWPAGHTAGWALSARMLKLGINARRRCASGSGVLAAHRLGSNPPESPESFRLRGHSLRTRCDLSRPRSACHHLTGDVVGESSRNSSDGRFFKLKLKSRRAQLNAEPAGALFRDGPYRMT